MIGRAAALADIVGPVAVAPPARWQAWPGAPGWLLPIALMVLAAAVLGSSVLLVAALRRRRARARLRALTRRLRTQAPEHDVATLLPAVWRELRLAGVPSPGCWPETARALRRHLLYARRPRPEALRALLAHWLPE